LALSRLTGCWPTGGEELLLRAVLLEGDAARGAWDRWRALDELEHLDEGCHRLLPLLYLKLVDLGVDDPMVARLKGVYRQSWARNQILFRQAGVIIGALHRAGIETIALKGVALSVLHYRDLGARPMEDADVLVPRDLSGEAIEVLCNAGWVPSSNRPEIVLRARHAEAFANEDGGRLDLHWDALFHPGRDEEFWVAAVPAEVAGTPTRALGPADQLLHVCLHGAAWNGFARAYPDKASHVRWVADAVTVLGTSPELDWSRVVEQGQRRRLTVALAETLSYLRERFVPSIPAAVISELEATPSVRSESAAQRAAMQRPGVLRTVRVERDRYRRLREVRPRGARPHSFPAYIRDQRGFEHYWELAAHWVRRLARSPWRRRGEART
jgi:Uncharacterised nucleotidyltransferase